MSKRTSARVEFLGFAIDYSAIYKITTAKFIKENIIFAAGILVGFALLITGIFQLLNPGQNNQIEIIAPATGEQAGKILVDVAGAVEKPGVYTLESEARVRVAIEAAGGFSNLADFSWISKNLNLAAKISDGAKIFIPAKGEQSTLGVQGTQLLTNYAKVNINSASQSQLEALPAIGPVTASKIVNGRPYNSVEELLTKKVVGKSTFEKIKELISVF